MAINKWLQAMPGGPPKAIIIDQDLEMAKAIEIVMPNTCHHYCLWHILDKLPIKLARNTFHKDGFLESLKNCVYNTDTPEHFECEWNKILEDFDILNNECLKNLYNICAKWVPIYLKHMFFGGMSTTQRSESINAFVKQYVS